MSKAGSSLKTIVGCVGICTVFFLVFLSVLGVNNSVHGNMKNFLGNMSSKNYSQILESYATDAEMHKKSFQERMQYHFFLELAILEYFDLLNDAEYKVSIKRENLWIPLITKNSLMLSLSLVPNDDGGLVQNLVAGGDKKTLNNFIRVVREDEKWKIEKINVSGSALDDMFKRIESEVELEKYISFTTAGFSMQGMDIELDNISPLERRVLVNNLKTALEVIEQSKSQ